MSMGEPSFTPYKGGAHSTEWIDSTEALAEFCQGAGTVTGFDTEFVRTRTFYPLPGLYQLIHGDRVALVDPLSSMDFSGLRDWLTDASVTKVMHACTEDLELVQYALGVKPASVFDTQLAYAFVSNNFSTSYAKLVEALLGVKLDKHETRSNWRQRPLTEQQKVYAALDVVYLEPLHEALTDRLNALGRLSWFQEDMAPRGEYRETTPEGYYQTVRKAWRLLPEQLGRFQALCAWRERQAREENVPRNRVVWDDHLIEMAGQARLEPGFIQGLLPGKLGARYSNALLAAYESPAGSAGPTVALDPPLTQKEGEVLKKIRRFGVQRAEELGMAVELLARKRDVEALIRSWLKDGSFTPTFLGWRRDVLGRQFETLVESELHALG